MSTLNLKILVAKSSFKNNLEFLDLTGASHQRELVASYECGYPDTDLAQVGDAQLRREQEVRKPPSVAVVLGNSGHAVELNRPGLHEAVDRGSRHQVEVAGDDAGEVGRRLSMLDADEGEPIQL